MYKRQGERAWRHAAQQIRALGAKSITKDNGFEPDPLSIESSKEEIQKAVAKRLRFISTLNDTTFKRLEGKVSDAIAEGQQAEESTAQIAARVREAMGSVYDSRGANAQMIAQTETGTITSQIQYAAGGKFGGLDKGWLSTRDELVRPDHAAADAQGFIPYDEEFAAPEMAYPLDPAGEADEVINCRCALIFAHSKEE